MADSIFIPTRLGDHWVPGIWRYFLPEDVFYFRIDPEKKSSCFDCPQVKDAGFHPVVRCCWHIPRVSNFMLGFALQAEATAARVQAQIDKGFVTPEAMQVSPLQLQDVIAHIAPKAGEEPKTVCPFLDRSSKACGIYAFRNASCSSFFCHHDRGEASALFWDDLQGLVGQIESALAQWALEAVGFDLNAYFSRFDSLAEDLGSCSRSDGSWSDFARRRLFAEWYGRESELFMNCAKVISDSRDRLYDLAKEQKLKQTKTYDQALRRKLEENFRASLVAEALPDGEAESIDSLWYSLRLSQRNMQLSPLNPS